MKLEELAKEKIEELKKLGSPEEMLAFLEKEGVELSDDELQLINGGAALSALSDSDDDHKMGVTF